MSSDLKLRFDRLSYMAGLVNEDVRYKIAEGIPLNEKTDYTQYDPADFSDEEEPTVEQPHGYTFDELHGADHKGGQGGDPLDMETEKLEEQIRKKIRNLLKEAGPWGGLTRKNPGQVNMGGVGLGFQGWEPNDEMITGAQGFEFIDDVCTCEESGCPDCFDDSPPIDPPGRYGHGSQKPARGDARRSGGYIPGPGF